MERPYFFKQPLSDVGEKRWSMAEDIHAAVWQHNFKGQNEIRRVGAVRHDIVEYRLPRIEQILDFVQRFVRLRIHGKTITGVELTLPARPPHHDRYRLNCVTPLPDRFVIEQ